ncbi:MAG: hypothetical protein WAK91_02510 [Candidatus Acidiferrales bacterium]|jgi:hypothetical protein
MERASPTTTTAPANLFRLFNEIVLLLLGALLMLLAASHRLRPSTSPVTWILLGVLLIYWSARAGMRWAPPATRWHERMRAGSFAIAGIAILSIAWIPFRDAPLALGIAGGVMALRGLLSAAAFARGAIGAK